MDADLVAVFTRRARDITVSCTNLKGGWFYTRRMRFVQDAVMLKTATQQPAQPTTPLTVARGDELSSCHCTSRLRTASTWRGILREVRSGEAAAATERTHYPRSASQGRVYAAGALSDTTALARRGACAFGLLQAA